MNKINASLHNLDLPRSPPENPAPLPPACAAFYPHPRTHSLSLKENFGEVHDSKMQFYYGHQMPLRILDEAEFWKRQEEEHTIVIRELVPKFRS